MPAPGTRRAHGAGGGRRVCGRARRRPGEAARGDAGRSEAAPPSERSARGAWGGAAPVILVIDNYDSFTYNLVQYLAELGAQVDVRRNDAIDVEAVRWLEPEAVVISPGPGRPEDA